MSSKASKNNPEARGKVTELRKYNGKPVKPVLFIQRGVGRYIAAMFEDGTLVVDKTTKLPIAYKNI
jgi:hypothetical protein